MTPEDPSAPPSEQSPVSLGSPTTSRKNADLIMEILIRGSDEVKPVRDVHFIAEATGKTVAQVREKFAELGIAPSASSNDSVSDNINLGRKSRKPRERANTEEAPPLTHWDTLAPGQKAVVGAFFGHDGTVFDGLPRKDLTTIANSRGTTYAGAYALLQGGLKKLRSVERPTRKKRASKSPKRREIQQKRIFIQPVGRPMHALIPEEKTQTYEDLLVWLRTSENASLVASLEDAVKFTKMKYSTYAPSKLSAKIFEKFKEGFLGDAVITLACYLKPGILVQDFIRDIRPPVQRVLEKPTTTLSPTKKPAQPVAQRPTQNRTPKKPFSRTVFVPPRAHRHSGKPFIPSQPDVPKKPENNGGFPEFTDLEHGAQWLGTQEQFKEFIVEAGGMQDDLAISAFLAKKSQLLLRILLTLKSNFSAPSIRSILIKVFPQKDKEGDVASPQPPIEQEESTLPSSPDTTRATEDAGKTDNPLHMTPEHEARIREIFALHTSGQYREFWDAFQGLSGTEIFTELQEVRDAFKLSSYLDTLAYIADYTLSEKDVVHYRHHKKRYSRIGNMPGVATQLRRLLERGTQEAHKMNTIRSILSETPLKVPSMSGAPDTIREEWFGFDEDDAQSRTLFEVVVALVKTRPAYKKKDEDSTKKLLRVVKLLLGLEQITADDEKIGEE